MVQFRKTQDITITEWWEQVHPYAVTLEKNITTSPHEMNYEDVYSMTKKLSDLIRLVQQISCPSSASAIREYLVRATTYLLHAYQELENGNTNEVDFYYSSALTQVAKLHYQLVKHGFAN